MQRTSVMSDNLVCVRNSLTDIMEAMRATCALLLNLYATDACGRAPHMHSPWLTSPPPTQVRDADLLANACGGCGR